MINLRVTNHSPARLIVPGPALLVCFAIASCATGGNAGTGSARPRLTLVAPDSVRLITGNVTEVDLRGSGFDTNATNPQNVVRIGSLELRAVPSRLNGTVIRVAIPDAVPSGGEAPPAPWSGGRFRVTVTTRFGTSDTLTLAIATSGGLRP